MITGSKGQLGFELNRTCPAETELVKCDLPDFDVSNRQQVFDYVRAAKPSVVINAAAYTAVDTAETQSALAFSANRDGAMHLAQAAAEMGSEFLHVSTDFVFSGTQGNLYLPTDPYGPLSVYGESKAQGELAVIEAHPRARIVRTSWVYSSHGGNFVKTMLRLMAEKPMLNVVADQIGTPTWANGLAKLLWKLADPKTEFVTEQRILHYADAGIASWFDFAVAIQEEALGLGLLQKPIPINPIPAVQYPTPAKRPAFSGMDRSSGWEVSGVPPHWRAQLRSMLKELNSQ